MLNSIDAGKVIAAVLSTCDPKEETDIALGVACDMAIKNGVSLEDMIKWIEANYPVILMYTSKNRPAPTTNNIF